MYVQEGVFVESRDTPMARTRKGNRRTVETGKIYRPQPFRVWRYSSKILYVLRPSKKITLFIEKQKLTIEKYRRSTRPEYNENL